MADAPKTVLDLLTSLKDSEQDWSKFILANQHNLPPVSFQSMRPSGAPISLMSGASPGVIPFMQDFQSKSRLHRKSNDIKVVYDIELYDPKDSFITGKMQKIMNQKMQQMLAMQTAAMTGIGRAAIDAARKMEELSEAARLEERSFDQVDILDLPIDVLLNKARWTIGSALDEARNPLITDSPAHVQGILSSAMNLAHMVRVMEDHVYDWNLNDREGNTLRRATNTFQEAERAHSIRYNHGARRSRTDILANLGKRLQEDIQYTRTTELMLRETLRNPRGDREWDNLRPGEFIEACFTAALNLETFYEDRVFGEREASAR